MIRLKIRECREAAGMTQRQLAAKLGVAHPSVCKWELGLQFPSADKIPLIADALRCSIDALYGREPPGAARAS